MDDSLHTHTPWHDLHVSFSILTCFSKRSYVAYRQQIFVLNTVIHRKRCSREAEKKVMGKKKKKKKKAHKRAISAIRMGQSSSSVSFSVDYSDWQEVGCGYKPIIGRLFHLWVSSMCMLLFCDVLLHPGLSAAQDHCKKQQSDSGFIQTFLQRWHGTETMCADWFG